MDTVTVVEKVDMVVMVADMDTGMVVVVLLVVLDVVLGAVLPSPLLIKLCQYHNPCQYPTLLQEQSRYHNHSQCPSMYPGL